MEQAAAEGLMAQAALAIPYGNLASMYEQMGDAQSAPKYSEMAARQATNKPKRYTRRRECIAGFSAAARARIIWGPLP